MPRSFVSENPSAVPTPLTRRRPSPSMPESRRRHGVYRRRVGLAALVVASGPRTRLDRSQGVCLRSSTVFAEPLPGRAQLLGTLTCIDGSPLVCRVVPASSQGRRMRASSVPVRSSPAAPRCLRGAPEARREHGASNHSNRRANCDILHEFGAVYGTSVVV
jgi:hypothetical protein